MGRKESGFTLLEIILATMLAGGIFLALAGAFSSFSAAWERAEKRYAGREDFWFCWRSLEGEFSSLLVPAFGLGPFLTGGPDGCRFLAGHPAMGRGPWETTISLMGDRLVLTRLPLREPGEKKEEILLATGIERVSFAYWDPVTRDWQSSWLEAGRVPSLVRLELSFSAAKGRKTWPVFVFPVYAGRSLAGGEEGQGG